jgi:uncharacterized NAD-dependent epimerase/dehydratase family protein
VSGLELLVYEALSYASQTTVDESPPVVELSLSIFRCIENDTCFLVHNPYTKVPRGAGASVPHVTSIEGVPHATSIFIL